MSELNKRRVGNDEENCVPLSSVEKTNTSKSMQKSSLQRALADITLKRNFEESIMCESSMLVGDSYTSNDSNEALKVSQVAVDDYDQEKELEKMFSSSPTKSYLNDKVEVLNERLSITLLENKDLHERVIELEQMVRSYEKKIVMLYCFKKAYMELVPPENRNDPIFDTDSETNLSSDTDSLCGKRSRSGSEENYSYSSYFSCESGSYSSKRFKYEDPFLYKK